MPRSSSRSRAKCRRQHPGAGPPVTDADFGGDLVLIDTRNLRREHASRCWRTPGCPARRSVRPPATMCAPCPASRPAAASRRRSRSGTAPGRIAVSWTPCRAQLNGQDRACTDDVLRDPAVQLAAPLYSIWMYDTAKRAFLPLMPPEAGRMITDIVVAQPRTRAGGDPRPDVPGVDAERGPGRRGRRRARHQERLRLRRRRYRSAEHRDGRQPGAAHGRAAPGPLRAHREGRVAPGPGHPRHRRFGLRREQLSCARSSATQWSSQTARCA